MEKSCGFFQLECYVDKLSKNHGVFFSKNWRRDYYLLCDINYEAGILTQTHTQH